MNNLLISGIVLGSGILIFIILFLRNKWKARGKDIQEYEEGRDKLTFREKKEENEPEVEYSGGVIGSVISGFIVLVIGATLVPIVMDSMNEICSPTGSVSNITTASSQALCTGANGVLLNLTGIFFAIAIFLAAMGMVARPLRNAGLI